MFTQLKELQPDLPYEENFQASQQFLLIKDTINTEGNFIISSLINTILKKNEEQILFLGAHQNYAHYLNTSKKLGCSLEQHILKKRLEYIDLQSEINDWIPQDLPFTEKTSNNYIQPPSTVKKVTISDNDNMKSFQQIIKIIENSIKEGKKHVILDNLTSFFNFTEDKALIFQFFSELYKFVKTCEVNLYILVTCLADQKLLKQISLIEQYPDTCFEFFENPSGYQQDVAGQLIVKQQQTGKASKFLVFLTENQIKLSINYQA